MLVGSLLILHLKYPLFCVSQMSASFTCYIYQVSNINLTSILQIKPASFERIILNIFHQTMTHAASIPTELTIFSWYFEIPSNIFPIAIYVSSSLSVMQSCKFAFAFKPILFFTFHFVSILDTESFHIKFLCCSFIYWQSAPDFCQCLSQHPSRIQPQVYFNAIYCLST